jgi:hypothetical protein
MRTKLMALMVVAGVAGAVAVVAAAKTTANGLPKYTDGYAKWTKLNRKPITAPGAHTGVKNVYASKAKAGKLYPNGTVVVKSIAEPGKKGLPKQVAVMRKVAGKWQFVEYELGGSRYGVLAKGAMCQSCHMQAKANDYVFTKR